MSPIDLVPEVIFGVFGILDDILFLLMCLFCVAIILVYPLFAEMRRKLLFKLGLLKVSATNNSIAQAQTVTQGHNKYNHNHNNIGSNNNNNHDNNKLGLVMNKNF